ncbi:hypothetical protein [Spirosoma radiotolerans]|uniref:Curlin associated repeat-containing protein n=1 Tax=Spirosoma radiotolerans TaxID=1379870 RepID=A0A0E3ZYY1_9BACT|nr:hypothetical protein [Spirosoma radiotolerans]AKD57293.1 hypothetical protein SD10_22765 [Spirosoma radiotolerans]
MKRFFIFSFWIAGIAAQAQSQSGTRNTQDAFWNLTSVPSQVQATLKLGTNSVSDPGSSLNDVTARQDGANNTALLSIVSGAQNRLEVNQTNGHNYSDVTLSGVNNSVLLNQTGGNNSTSFGLSGANNRFMLTQDGGDRLQMTGLQQSNTRLEVAQGIGNNTLTIDNTSLFRDASGVGLPNLRIEQSGGATATIQNGRLFGN